MKPSRDTSAWGSPRAASARPCAVLPGPGEKRRMAPELDSNLQPQRCAFRANFGNSRSGVVTESCLAPIRLAIVVNCGGLSLWFGCDGNFNVSTLFEPHII